MAGEWQARLRHAWSAFSEGQGSPEYAPRPPNGAYGYRPDRPPSTVTNERSIVTAIMTRIAIDAASVDVRHIRVDGQGRYLDEIPSALNQCLSVSANVDQAAREFLQDAVANLLDKGYIAIVPTEATYDITATGAFDVNAMRVAEILEWYPRHVRVKVWDDRELKGGKHRELTLPKERVAIVTNPLYETMNRQDSTVRRLMRKLQILDAIDEQNGSGKLDIIIQLPYVVKSELRRQEAEKRRADLELQLKNAKYGVAYTDGTEKIVQLNRPTENNMLAQVEYLTKMLYSQLGVTDEIMNGTADEKTMLNYMNRTVEPILTAVVQSLSRAFLTKTARTQGQRIVYYRAPFKLVSMTDIADIADKLSRNEILTSNELRGLLGFKPAEDPKADQLVNSNMPQADPNQPVVDPAAQQPLPDQNPA